MSGGKGNIQPEDGKPFIKGDKRINRKGRPRKIPDLDRLLREVLSEKLRDEKLGENPAMKWILLSLRNSAIKKGDVRAAELLMDRAYGKLKQTTGLEIDIKKLSDEQLIELIERLFKKE